MDAAYYNAHAIEARIHLSLLAQEFNRQVMNREVKKRAVAKELGVDHIRLHHFSHGRMILDDDEMQRVIEWMLRP